MFVYVGSYTEAPLGFGEGIVVYRFDAESGGMTPVQTVAGVQNPSYLALNAAGTGLFAVNEIERGEVSAFLRDPQSGELTPLNRQLSHGSSPCFISLDAGGKFAFVANYGGQNVTVLQIARVGRLDPAKCVAEHKGASVNPRRQAGPHPHMIAATPDGNFVLATDLGTDEIVVYTIDEFSGELTRAGATKTEPGSGPRHFAFAPNGRTLYAINELDNTLAVYDYDGDRGQLTPRQISPALPADFTGTSYCAHVAVSPDGRFVYGSNRGHDSIAIWAVDDATGEVSLIGHEPTRGKEPRHFSLDPSGEWLLVANQNSGTVVSFRRDAATGRLTPAGPAVSVPTPVCVIFSRT
ncbi:MAG: lactonase family protein [Thermomicrobiales bacterium]|nr:lactonase family protein [Thermomicrobiales bacterium]